MPKELVSLAIADLEELADEYHQLVRAQQLIRLCLEEDISSHEGQDTVLLLLECYRSRMMLHLDELKAKFQQLQLQAMSPLGDE